jgi:hypothetical protein
VPDAARLVRGAWSNHPGESGTSGMLRQIELPTGERYIAKNPKDHLVGRTSHHEIGHELAVSEIFQRLGIPILPMRKVVKDGVAHIVMPYLHDAVALKYAPQSLVSSVDRRRAAAVMLGNWLVNGADRNKGNYLIRPHGQLVPIDYGNSVWPTPANSINWGVNPEALLIKGLVAKHDPLDPALIRKAHDERGPIMDILRKHVLPLRDEEGPFGARNIEEMMAAKFAALHGLQGRATPEVRDLWDHPTQDRETIYDLAREYQGVGADSLRAMLNVEPGRSV